MVKSETRNPKQILITMHKIQNKSKTPARVQVCNRSAELTTKPEPMSLGFEKK